MADTINFYGALFENKGAVPQAIRKATEETKRYGLQLVKANTPVSSGRLKAAWEARLEGNGIRWTNTAPYSTYVEMGTRFFAGRHMLGRALPEIRGYFQGRLQKHLGKNLATKAIEEPGNNMVYKMLTQGRQSKGFGGGLSDGRRRR